MPPSISHEANRSGLTLLEMLIGITIFTAMLMLLSTSLGAAMRLLGQGEQRVEKFHSARSALEQVNREMSSAVVDTRMQFAVFPGELLQDQFGLDNIVEEASAALWMSPVNGDQAQVNCIGYFLTSDPGLNRYELKRIFVPPSVNDDPGALNPAYPKTRSYSQIRGEENWISPTDPSWFLRNWEPHHLQKWSPENPSSIVTTLASGVIAMWIQCYDQLGNPIPSLADSRVHPKSEMSFNSAAYFYSATTPSNEGKPSFRYAAEHDLSIKANQLPAEVEIVIVTLDKAQLNWSGEIPSMSPIGSESDLAASVAEYQNRLRKVGILESDTFSLRFSIISAN